MGGEEFNYPILMQTSKGLPSTTFATQSLSYINNYSNSKPKIKQSVSRESGAGFTIIELLVVVAIIAVLTGIVVANTTQYINRGKDSSIQGSLSSLSTNASVYFDSVGDYTSLCSDPTVTNPLAAADKANDGNTTPDQVTDCDSNATEWRACGQLKVTSADYFCVDYSGAKKIVTAATCAGGDDTACP
ncbi:MAG: hypothetical protein A3D44_01730 [Candidatus Staskawiczbacteria bacterium RIFCSPHIGHO2_02_FULL_42_22]|uniref:Type II secretion system protein GspG C-terminal domain-containing protein n=1 Tax=Candidatus Staskawiczbacteria bacterium RIFCSPHIGHO2_02_FULL_42_22 TaxID=1802207 RepID=A0A1G2I117_9BACT|nr:MAG: hypothetical protein A3D44_01730 [Candidatus Staskawiczbacteria bacterium RIFCSPHIGHO2_02_FULL_42_22]